MYLQDRDIIIDVFGQIIENAEAMKKESEDTRTRLGPLRENF